MINNYLKLSFLSKARANMNIINIKLFSYFLDAGYAANWMLKVANLTDNQIYLYIDWNHNWMLWEFGQKLFDLFK